MQFERKSRISNWVGPDLDRQTERRAALKTMELLKQLEAAYVKTIEEGAPLHWIFDTGVLGPDVCRFLYNSLGTGEVRITLYDGQATATETDIPGLWLLSVGGQESLVAALLPLCVKKALDQGRETIDIPEDKPEGLFASEPLLKEVAGVLAQTDISQTSTSVPYQVDMMRQPLTPADKSFLLTVVGRGSLSVELLGFADSRIFSTKVRGLWRSVIINNAGKVLLDSLVVARIPPEVPAAPEDLPEGLGKIRSVHDWIENDLNRGALG